MIIIIRHNRIYEGPRQVLKKAHAHATRMEMVAVVNTLAEP